MKSGHCPKCGGTDIIEVAEQTRGGIISGQTIFTMIYSRRYVCGNCGFMEEYADESDIPKLKKRYQS